MKPPPLGLGVYYSILSNRLYTKEYTRGGELGMHVLWHGCARDIITSVSYVHACTHGVAEKVPPQREQSIPELKH